MKRRGVILSSILTLFILIAAGVQPPTSNSKIESVNNSYNNQATTDVRSDLEEKIETPTCDGENITADCIFEGVEYSKYIYHEAVPEKSHNETITNYREEIAGYCTLCNDGTYSPSCATGRGACSHHGGVAQWNAPRYRSVPEYITNKIIDQPAQEAYYETVIAE